MKYYRLICIAFILLIYLPSFADGQVTLSSLSFRIGTIQAFPSPEGKNVFNPEIQIGGQFVTRPFNWGIYYSYWNDGDNQDQWMDYMLFSYTNHIVGVRLSCSFKQIDSSFILPIDIFSGIAKQFIHAKYVNGFDYSGRSPNDYSTSLTTYEFGLSIHMHIIEDWSILVEAQQYFPFGNSYLDQLQNKYIAFKVGLNYSL